MEEWTTIRYLNAQGKSIRAIAQELGVARNTVRQALRAEQKPSYTRPKRANPKLEPFAAEIERMYFEQRFIGSRILREVRALGYRGGKTALYSYLEALKAAQPDPRLSVRFETAPGQQAQFDWSPYAICVGGHSVKVIIYCLTLSYSRRKHYWPSLDETANSIYEAIEVSLRHYGGAPKELLVDNARALVKNANPACFEWNEQFLGLCGHYSIRPVACQPGRPRTKGKVERPFFYLEQHFIKGSEWPSFDAFAQQLEAFTQEELDRMVHSTTKEAPIERFEQERGVLTPLPVHSFVGGQQELRKVSWDCLISWGGSRYSVPWRYAGKQVWVRTSQGRSLIVLAHNGEEVARHTLTEQKGLTTIDGAHYEGLRQGLPKTKALLTETFLDRFPGHGWFVEGVFAQHKPNGVAHLRAILALAEIYSREALLVTFSQSKEYNSYSHSFIRGLLESGGASHQTPTPEIVVCSLGDSEQVLSVYQRILETAR